jgi:hypothetical protein
MAIYAEMKSSTTIGVYKRKWVASWGWVTVFGVLFDYIKLIVQRD